MSKVEFSEKLQMTRKAFLLRIDPALLDELKKWAEDDLRSLNGQIEFVLREALTKARRASMLVNEDKEDN